MYNLFGPGKDLNKEAPKKRGRKRKNPSDKAKNAKQPATRATSAPKNETPPLLAPIVEKQTKKATRKEAKADSCTLDECTKQVLGVLQRQGNVILKDLRVQLGIDSRRSYDILNVLRNTPLLKKSPNKKDQGYLFLGEGKPFRKGECDVATLLKDIESESQAIEDLLRRMSVLEEMMDNESEEVLRGLKALSIRKEEPSDITPFQKEE